MTVAKKNVDTVSPYIAVRPLHNICVSFLSSPQCIYLFLNMRTT